MSQGFDPYYKWLGISPAEQPANHYRLLGINLFEADPDVIQAAADQRMAHLKGLRLGKHVDLSERLLNEVAAARACLLNTKSKEAYDLELATQIESSRPSVDLPLFPNSDSQLLPTRTGLPRSPSRVPPAERSLPKGGGAHGPRRWFVDLIVLGILLVVCAFVYEFLTRQPPGKLSIVLENAPRGAVVLVDGKEVENLARAVVLTPGKHEVIIRADDGTVLRRQSVMIEPDEPKTIYVSLKTPSTNE